LVTASPVTSSLLIGRTVPPSTKTLEGSSFSRVGVVHAVAGVEPGWLDSQPDAAAATHADGSKKCLTRARM
jgi:hypothetical protein